MGFDLVFLDPSGTLNLTARVSASMYANLRHEATLAVTMLDHPFLDSFDPLFMTHVQKLKFDVEFHVRLSQSHPTKKIKKIITCSADSQPTLNSASYLSRQIYGILKRAFTDRVKLIMVKLYQLPV